jgi:type I restriction-modification system DNA methylase subunit
VPDTPLQDKKTVLQILESFKGTGPLRELLANLNYDPLNEAVSRGDWPDGAKAALAQDPRLYGRAAREFYVIYAQLAADKLKLTDERAVVPQLLKQYPYALFVFSDKSQTNFHFVNVKWENTQKRRLYRRITVGPQERLRTAVERITLLDTQTIPAGLFGVKAQEIQDRHDEAFDVAKVTKDFYEEYKRVFEVMRDSVKGFGASDEEKERRHLFTQRLFNRLMFLRFIQKKGWLTIDGSTDYLAALWASHGKLKQEGKNFYEDRLKLLFAALNNEQAGIVLQGKGGVVEATIGRVKYLNGGLFEETAEDRDPRVRVADGPFNQIFDKATGLFEAFNFTITESTPLDVEIAVDPEMLGKIFEELVTGRHETGSYYTPKAVVSFMCREALKSYLETSSIGETRQAIELFVEKHESDHIQDAEMILDALRRVTVCDPACGSGAYLLGMLHELLGLREALFRSRKLDAKSAYERKLEIIQTNIYGVDIDLFTVNIARLRLWLSLAVDYDKPDPQPLPNLDYKLEPGDSLLAPLLLGKGQASFHTNLIDEYLKLKKTYLTAHGNEKAAIKKRIESSRHDIAAWTHGNDTVPGFDWSVEFAEVFIKNGGFDVIVANPPYVRADAQFKHITDDRQRTQEIQRWRDYRERLNRSDLYTTLYEKWDLYIPFLERAHQLLRERGQMEFIIPDSYNTAKYAMRSHEVFGAESIICRIDFCTDINLFDAGVNNTIVSFTKVAPVEGYCPARIRRWGESGEEFEANQEVQPAIVQNRANIDSLFRLGSSSSRVAKGDGIPLSNICYLSWGLRPNADDDGHRGEFTTADVISDHRDKTHPKKLVQGKDTVKWWPIRIRYLEWGTERAPAQFARPTFPELYAVPQKLLAMKVSGRLPRVVFDEMQLICTDAFCCCVLWHELHGVRNRSIKKTARYRNEVTSTAALPGTTRDELETISKQFSMKYLLGIMNSEAAAQWLEDRRRNKIQLYPEDWKNLPIPLASKDDQRAVEKLVEGILDLFRQNQYPMSALANKQIENLEKKLDEVVDRLYQGRG